MPSDSSTNNLKNTMPVDRTGDFTASWCQEILDDPMWERIPFGWLLPLDQKYLFNQFWSGTLSSAQALRAVQGLRKSNRNEQEDAPDVMMLMSLGEGLAGAPDTMHGGFTATALDMIAGFAVNMTEPVLKMISTATLKIDYKAPIAVPSVYIAKARVIGREGRKRWINATFEDGNGKVMASAEAMYVVLKEKV